MVGDVLPVAIRGATLAATRPQQNIKRLALAFGHPLGAGDRRRPSQTTPPDGVCVDVGP
jgi:hypothetical protein